MEFAGDSKRRSSWRPVNIAAVADLDHFNHGFGLRHGVENAVVALAQAVALLRCEFLGVGRTRIVAQGLDAREDALHIRRRNARRSLATDGLNFSSWDGMSSHAGHKVPSALSWARKSS